MERDGPNRDGQVLGAVGPEDGHLLVVVVGGELGVGDEVEEHLE